MINYMLKNIQKLTEKNTLYQGLIFSAAFLLFSIQPMISKFILPWFGGSPSVWTTALLFFQFLLLIGYVYAHLISRFNPRFQKFLYLTPLFLALMLLPIIPDPQWQPAESANPAKQILLLLLITVGLPYLILAATSPLLQSWFSKSGSETATYRLYTWSNAGSLLGLFSYPVLIEPLLTLEQQATLWSMAFFLLVVGMSLLTVTWRPQFIEKNNSAEILALKPKLLQKILWVALPALGSLLLVATTNYITQDVASVPFLWILPLGLYLLSFIITFHGNDSYDRKFFQPLFVISGLLGVYLITQGGGLPIVLMLTGSLGMLFVYCLVCHGELYSWRPHPRYLTSFYLWLSAGGALGGAFVALIAPTIFPLYFEFHLGVGLTFVVIMVLWLKKDLLPPMIKSNVVRLALVGFLTTIVVGGLVFNAKETLTQPTKVSRDFFGVIRIFKTPTQNDLYHGRVVHGTQFTAEEKKCLPTTYYGYSSGIGRAAGTWEGQKIRLGVIGLGTGTIAAYGDDVRFYELSPAMAEVTKNDFSYLTACSGQIEIIIGDGRLSLERETPQQFDILAIDAFSSDTIPIHLLTREAITVYLKHLKPTGVLAIHISNRYVNLKPVVADIKNHFEIPTVIVEDSGDGRVGTTGSTWALLSYDQTFFERIATDEEAEKDITDLGPAVIWTDKYSNLLKVLRFQ